MDLILLFPLIFPNVGLFAYFNFILSLTITLFILFKSKKTNINIRYSIIVFFALLSTYWAALLSGSFTLSKFALNIRDIFEFARIIPYVILFPIMSLAIQYNFIRTIIFFFIFNVLFCIFQYLYPYSLALQIYTTQEKQFSILYTHRLVGFLDNPNMFSFYLVITYFFFYERITLPLKYFLFIFIFFMLSIVGSRTGFITFLTVTTLLLLMRSTGVKRYLSLFILTGIFFVLFLYKDMWISILSFLSPYMGYGIDMALSNRIEELQTITDRLQFWLDDINYFYLSPIFGVGPGYGFMERSFSDNTYIYLLARYGIVGFLTYLFSLLLLYKWAHRNRSIFLYAVLISFIVFGLTAEVFLHNLILYYLSILFFTYNFKTKDMKSK